MTISNMKAKCHNKLHLFLARSKLKTQRAFDQMIIWKWSSCIDLSVRIQWLVQKGLIDWADKFHQSLVDSKTVTKRTSHSLRTLLASQILIQVIILRSYKFTRKAL